MSMESRIEDVTIRGQVPIYTYCPATVDAVVNRWMKDDPRHEGWTAASSYLPDPWRSIGLKDICPDCWAKAEAAMKGEAT
jgi:hypothetical protein